MHKRYLFILLFSCIFSCSVAQRKYWVYYHPDSINGKDIIEQNIIELGGKAIFHSSWLKAWSCVLQDSIIDQINKNTTVVEITAVMTLQPSSLPDFPSQYTTALQQINSEVFTNSGLTGKDVKVGIIDSGFLDAPQTPELDDFFYYDQVIAYKDFTGEERPMEAGNKSNNDHHGTRVWTHIGGYDREKDRITGLATGSLYYLARTDIGGIESRVEEDYWIAAIEWMSENGVQVVNSSLVYSENFDNPAENHSPSDIDGKSTAITRAAEIAVTEKNIVLVLAAGNNGEHPFKVLSVPADAPSAITVGSCGTGLAKKMSYSSSGPENLSNIKPELCVYSLAGTSFTAPVISGVCALIKEYSPNLSPQEVKDIITKSSHLYPYANNLIGYGIPDARKILQLLDNRSAITWTSKSVKCSEKTLALEVEESEVIIYHKTDKVHVHKEEILSVSNGRIEINRMPGIQFTTVYSGSQLFEIEWK